MERLTQGYEKFIKGKELKENGKDQFNRAIRKAGSYYPFFIFIFKLRHYRNFHSFDWLVVLH